MGKRFVAAVAAFLAAGYAAMSLGNEDASADVECALGNACAPEGFRCSDDGNRSLECSEGKLHLARPPVSGSPCPIKDAVSRDTCGQTLTCTDGSWADTLGNFICA
ncbi:MAG: hypothetical protein V1745_04100 [Patescibacteria group bacterium]